MATNYARGRRFEYKVRDYIKTRWPLVIRSAGSKSLIDIVAVRPKTQQTMLVSCKKSGYWPKKELSALRALEPDYIKVSVVLAYLNKQGNLEFKNLDD